MVIKTVEIVSEDAVSVGDKRTRRPLSFTANVNTHPEFARNLSYYRDAKVMTPLVMFLLDSLLESGESVDEITRNYEQHISRMASELLKDESGS